MKLAEKLNRLQFDLMSYKNILPPDKRSEYEADILFVIGCYQADIIKAKHEAIKEYRNLMEADSG